MLTDEQIFDILDGCASAELLLEHAQLMTKSLEYKQYFKELEAIHFDLAELPLEVTSASFTEKILAGLPEEKPIMMVVKRKTWTGKLTYGFVGSIVVMFLVTVWFAIKYQTSSVAPVEQTTLVNNYLNEFQTDVFVKIAVLLNLIILLAVFDRRVLRPYFSHRKITLG
jgi:hypothetical protein